VYHNDRITIDGVKQLIADGAVDSIILSPGPGSPLVPADVGERRLRSHLRPPAAQVPAVWSR
jgi:anthranilate/para-aminobenzoate synthase component II